jgi:hypothetical protein
MVSEAKGFAVIGCDEQAADPPPAAQVPPGRA